MNNNELLLVTLACFALIFIVGGGFFKWHEWKLCTCCLVVAVIISPLVLENDNNKRTAIENKCRESGGHIQWIKKQPLCFDAAAIKEGWQ